ncbi:MAG: ArsR family transcriptional regulator, partial [Nitrosopumilaceae archaeon]|nr:ArsR family transcriptional regulator [Nitrosopumilaceae archaeon]
NNLMNSLVNDIDFNKNILIISDIQNTLQAEAASTSFTANNWNVSFLGDISDAIDVLFDIDLQKFFHKIMTDKELMLVLVFVESYEKLKFFSETLKGIKKKFNNDIFLMLFYDDVNVDVDADLITNDLKIVFQWADTKITGMSKWAE